MVCCNSANPEIQEILEYFHSKKLIWGLVKLNNDSTVRGSDNHRKGLQTLLNQVQTKKVVFLDNDAWPTRSGWVEFLLEESKGTNLYGVKQKRRGYVHPSCMILDAKFVSDHKAEFVKGDCAEGLSSVPYAKKRFMDVITSNVESKEDDDLGSLYGAKGSGYIYHMWGASRYTNQGVDYYSAEDVNRNLRITRFEYFPEVGVVIPTFGKIDEGVSIIDTFTSIRTGLPSLCPHIYDGDTIPSTSKAEIMNHAFWSIPCERIIFHDRDILATTKWGTEIDRCNREGEKIFLNQNGVYYEGKLEPNPPGGSITCEWFSFLKVGGFDNTMDGVGLEDREFLLRCEKVFGKPVQRLNIQLVHQDHPRKLKYGDYKMGLRDKVWNKTLSMEGRRDYIWQTLMVLRVSN
jgi:hypothetical protein